MMMLLQPPTRVVRPTITARRTNHSTQAPSCMRHAPSSSLQTATVAWLAAAVLAISTPAVALAAESTSTGGVAGGVETSDSPLVQELLARSKANKEKNDKERLDSYYRRNYKEYFEFVEGNVQRGGDSALSEETRQGIKQWLDANR